MIKDTIHKANRHDKQLDTLKTKIHKAKNRRNKREKKKYIIVVSYINISLRVCDQVQKK